jgi:4-amino-4-deoxy-L-arabinose transferase-like glycosyltransferase
MLHNHNHSRQTVLLLSLAVLVGWFGLIAINLGRYPLPYIDESFFHWPAISYLNGRGFVYAVSANAPFANSLWAYHGPFYPHLQVATFWLFGTSQLISRLPNLMAGYAAACLSAYLLWYEGYRVAPLIFSVVWIGDRATQELEYARMDGIALLCTVLTLFFLCRTKREVSVVNAFGVALFSSAAIAFHPVTGSFFLASSILVGFQSLTKKGMGHILLGYVLGLTLVLVLVLASIQFHPIEALQQFKWHALQTNGTHTLTEKWLNLIKVLRWSRWFFLTLMASTIVIAVPTVVIEFRKFRGKTDEHSFFRLSLALFAVTGLACMISKAVYPYYIIFFSLWPIALLATEAEYLMRGERPMKIGIVAAVILALAWMTSAGWNGMRMREAFLYRVELQHDYILGRLHQTIPANAIVFGDPLTSMIAEEAKIDFTPAMWEPEHTHPPREAWLFVTKSEYTTHVHFFPSDLTGRQVVFCSNAFPGAQKLAFDVCLLRPKS